MSANELPTLWSTKLRSTLQGVDHTKQVQHCLDRELVGIGWRIDELENGAPLAQVLDWIRNCPDPGWGENAARTVRRLGAAAEEGDFVWTRDTDGRYLLGRITGPYRYDISEAAKRVDVHQVRPVDWVPDPLNDLDVPGGVIRAFVGQGSSFARIHDQGARRLTAYLWEKLNGRELPVLDISPAEVLASYLDPYDVEDLVFVWLQVERGYIALPRSRQRGTPAYEWTMIHGRSFRRSIVQIKTGSDAVDLEALARATPDEGTETYAFATSGKYEGDTSLVSEVIAADDLLRFVRERRSVLPPRIRHWFDLAKG